MMIDCEMSRRTNGATTFLNEERKSLAVGAKIRINQTVILFGGFKKHCSRAIAENRAGGTVGVIHDRGKFVCTTNNYFLITPATNKVCAEFKSEKKTAARSFHIESIGIGHSQTSKDNRAGGREMIVGS